MTDIFPGSPVVCADHRNAAGHGFQGRHAQPFPDRGEKKDICSLKKKIQVLSEAEKGHLLFQPQTGSLLF